MVRKVAIGYFRSPEINLPNFDKFMKKTSVWHYVKNVQIFIWLGTGEGEKVGRGRAMLGHSQLVR